MIEMAEVADILKTPPKNSLIIFDEIGRGTSTFDGMSICPGRLWSTSTTRSWWALRRCSPPITTSSPPWRTSSPG